MMPTSLHIGDSGWRAVYTEGFSQAKLCAIGFALSRLYPSQKALLGHDNRFLSRELAEQLAFVLQKAGWQVELLSEIFPTPGIALLLQRLRYDWGLVITASHNPFYYNGLKILTREGLLSSRSLNQQLEQKALEKLESEKFPSLFPSKKIPSFSFKRAASIYLKQILKQVDVKKIRKADLKVVWDSFGGTTSALFPLFLKSLKIREKALESPPGPLFGYRRLEPEASSLQELKKLLLRNRAQVALATDLDGDRFAVLDEKGRFMLPNLIGPLMTWYLLEVRQEKGNIYQTVSASRLTEKICEKFGVQCHEMPVGFQVMGQKMKQDPQALLGIEETGGIAYAPHLCFKDGLMAHALLLEMLASQRKKLSQLVQEMYQKFGKYYYHRVDLPLHSEEMKTQWSERDYWKNIVGEKILAVSELDGKKFHFPSGWLLIRISKKEPLLRIYFESGKKEFIQKIKKHFFS